MQWPLQGRWGWGDYFIGGIIYGREWAGKNNGGGDHSFMAGGGLVRMRGGGHPIEG